MKIICSSMVLSPRMTRLCTFACSIKNHMLIRHLFCFLFLTFIFYIFVTSLYVILNPKLVMKRDWDWNKNY